MPLKRFAAALTLGLALSLAVAASAAENNWVSISGINKEERARETVKRLITVDDVRRLRSIGSLSPSPDRKHYAAYVSQEDPGSNDYRAAWFIGSIDGRSLLYIADAGEATFDGAGDLVGQVSLWSPDGRWIAYRRKAQGQVQLWRSRVDGTVTQQLTNNAADVQDFRWSADGKSLYFGVGKSRAALIAAESERARNGYRYDEDLYLVADLMAPSWMWSAEDPSTLWVVAVDDGVERIATSSDLASHEEQSLQSPQALVQRKTDAVRPASREPAVIGGAVARADGGAFAWLEKQRKASQYSRLVALYERAGARPKVCEAEECFGYITNAWWDEDLNRVIYLRRTGVGMSTFEVRSWEPSSNKISLLLSLPDDDLKHCIQALQGRLICARETPTKPAHIAALDFRSASVDVVYDINPEFLGIKLGTVERFQWDTPRFDWNEVGGRLEGLYAKKAYGYIMYPPDFDESRSYPVFIDPYVAKGFESSLGREHAQHVYAANGIVVVRMNFPFPQDLGSRFGKDGMREIYSADLDFPHLSMLAGSTVNGLRAAATRGFLDIRRVGIGGVSHGSFVPLYMLLRHDLLAAVSISSPNLTPMEYYLPTARMRGWLDGIMTGYTPRPEGKGLDFYSRIDLADHIGAIEAPILMNLAAVETIPLSRLIRGMADAGKPYDAYVFMNETHCKWQPAHLHAINQRNLDWFRFWLQQYEDPDPTKTEQYSRWRNLRNLNTSISESGH